MGEVITARTSHLLQYKRHVITNTPTLRGVCVTEVHLRQISLLGRVCSFDLRVLMVGENTLCDAADLGPRGPSLHHHPRGCQLRSEPGEEQEGQRKCPPPHLAQKLWCQARRIVPGCFPHTLADCCSALIFFSGSLFLFFET